MMKAYFAILTCQNGGITPMLDGEELATFDTLDECDEAAKQTVLGHHFGYEVFVSGGGEITR
jgi:hypothetical protein